MKELIISIFLTILFFACANKGPLTGGLADKEAPKIIASNPSSDTTNIGELRRFYFKFSERVDHRSFEEHLYLQPISEKRQSFEWSGWDEVWVSLSDSLEEGKTYQLTVAKGFTDLHQVPSEEEFKIAFSTKGELDHSELTGKIDYLGKPLKQIRLALFQEEKFDVLPLYIADLSSKNSFHLTRLKDANYTALFFNDKNTNFKFDIEDEEIAIPPTNFKLDSILKYNADLQFTRFDTLAPSIEKVDTLFRGLIRINFDEEIDLKNSELFLRDDSGKQGYFNSILFEKGKSALAQFDADSLFYPLDLDAKKLVDIWGNTKDSISFSDEIEESFQSDTSQFKLSSISIQDSMSLKSLTETIKIKFSTSFDWEKQRGTEFYLLNEMNEKVPLELQQSDSKTLEIRNKQGLEASKTYRFMASYKNLKNLFNKSLKDSLYEYRLYTPSRNHYAELSFTVKHSELDTLVAQIYKIGENKTLARVVAIPTNKDILIDKLRGGRYQLNFFDDKNRNGKHDLGRLKPFEHSERFYIHRDTISLRANWEKNIGEIKFETPF